MRAAIKYVLICLAFAFCIAKQAQATHIVGGDLTYRHIENDSFEITLVLYVDCFFGNPAAIGLDATAMVAVFGPNGLQVKEMVAARSLPVRINSVNLDCVTPPSNACVDQYIYKYHTTLPYIDGGYILAFQRCCRNNTILNIVNPNSSGTTFWCTIPDSVWSEGYNTAAVFKTLPPNYLCTGVFLSYDHSAMDADGDSLSYELYAPYLGADEFNSRPLPPSNPPYVTVKWSSAYGVNKMMLGNPELSIDPFTGILTVTPQNPGQYVVGIAVNEFRNGKLINTTRRDFQFNVFPCVVDVVSAFAKDIAACSDTVTFSNTSTGATSFLWDFGDTAVTTDTSTKFQPTHVYERTGVYKVTLLASKGNCKDSLSVNVTIDSDLGAFASNDTVICPGDAIMLSTNDSVNFAYQWTPSSYLSNAAIHNPVSQPLSTIRYIVTRISELCVNRDTVNITVSKPEATFSTGFIGGCKTATLVLDSVSAYPELIWYESDKQISPEDLLSKQFNYGETVRLKLIVSDKQCYDTVYKEIIPVETDSFDAIPNVFTPNGDGLNDCYKVKDVTLSKDCSHLEVYNRWGRKVYDSDDDGACWDGNEKGRLLASGVYYYILQHKGKNYHGTISLIR